VKAIVYYHKKWKKLNGTLFYSFEYYAFMRQMGANVSFIIVDIPPEDLEYIKTVFADKYTCDVKLIDDIQSTTRFGFLKIRTEHLLMFDVNSYTNMVDYMGRAKSISLYSNMKESFGLPYDSRLTKYGWYPEYQCFDKQVRLKLYKEIHKTYEKHGPKVFISSVGLNPKTLFVERIPELTIALIAAASGVNIEGVLEKEPDTHHFGLFEQINHIVYWHNGALDPNNRLLVEAHIHGIPVDVRCNGWYNDSVHERHALIESGQATDLFLTEDDLLIRDFIEK